MGPAEFLGFKAALILGWPALSWHNCQKGGGTFLNFVPQSGTWGNGNFQERYMGPDCLERLLVAVCWRPILSPVQPKGWGQGGQLGSGCRV